MCVDLMVISYCIPCFIAGLLCVILQLKSYVEEWFTGRRIAVVGVGKLSCSQYLTASLS